MPRKVIKVDTVKGVDLYVPATSKQLAKMGLDDIIEENKEIDTQGSNTTKEFKKLDLEGR